MMEKMLSLIHIFTVEKETKLRKQLREAGCEYKVVKNTLLSLAFKEAGIDGLEEFLNGTTAVSYTHLDVYKRQAFLRYIISF